MRPDLTLTLHAAGDWTARPRSARGDAIVRQWFDAHAALLATGADLDRSHALNLADLAADRGLIVDMREEGPR